MAWELVEEEADKRSGLEKFANETQRHLARTGTNVATRLAGLPGDVLSLANDFVAKPAYEAMSGKQGVPYEKSWLGKALPTTETQRENIKKGSLGDYLSPQSGVEKWIDDVVEDAATLINPTQAAKTGVKWATKAFKALAKSTGANLLGEGVKQASGSDQAGTATKIGALFLGSLMDQKGAAKQIGDLYRKAEANLPAGATTPSVKLSANLSSLKNSITKGRPVGNLSASERFVFDQIEKVETLIKNGQIPVDQLVAQKRSLNEELTKLYQTIPGKKDQFRARKLSKNINHYMNEAIEDYGKVNPSFVVPHREADKAFGTIAQSNWLSRWAEKHIKQSPITSGLMHLVAGPLGTTISSAVLPYQIAKLTYRIAKSPTLAKMYGKVVKSAVKEDAIAFNKYLNELDTAIQEEESKDYWEFIDQGSSEASEEESSGLSSLSMQ